MSYLPCHSLYISFIYCTSWVPTISVLNLAIFPCDSDLLLRRRRWTGILQRWFLGYVLPRLLFLWCCGVFRYSILLRVILVFKEIIYVIIILYIRDIWLSMSTFGHMCGTIDPGSCIRLVLGFGIKTVYDNYHDSWACGYQRSGIFFRLDGLVGNGMDFWSSLCGNFMITLCHWDHTLWYFNST
jgi:hypothetical protein